MKSDNDPCPCCSPMCYKNCCQPLHSNALTASSAEQLMRSRYSAFCVGDINYLITTLHASYRGDNDKVVLHNTIQNTHWLGLKVIEHSSGVENATVEFVAFYTGQPFEQLHELSHFKKESGQWFYTEGDVLPAVKLRSNDSCFCNSAKKYKKCHGRGL